MAGSLKLFVLSICSIIFLSLSVWSFNNYGIDSKRCNGNYIRPDYEKIPFASKSARLNERYALYLHREAGKKGFWGQPVLFLPGNAGTYRQIRSFGAVIERVWNWKKAADASWGNLDLFTMDTRGEFTAFDAGRLHDQAVYANEAIQHILGIYKGIKAMKTKPTSMLILGHSMGGVVARAIPLLNDYTHDSIMCILTLSSPHADPPLVLNYALESWYRTLNDKWRTSEQLANITMVSIASGSRDLILYSGLTHLDDIIKPEQGFSVYSTAMPGVWLSTDHEGMVWCDQVLTSVSLAMFQIFRNHLHSHTSRLVYLRDVLKGVRLNPQTYKSVSINSLDILVYANQNHIYIPRIETAETEIRYHYIRIPSGSQEYRLRLLTNLPKNHIQVYGSLSMPESAETLSCIDLTDQLDRAPSPTKEPFSLFFRRDDSTVDESPAEWTSGSILLDAYPFKGVVIAVAHSAGAFMFADIVTGLQPVGIIDVTQLGT